MAKTYTGVTFNGYHSYDDWGLKLKEIQIEVPEAKTEYIELQGVDGDIDLTEIRNDGVKYGMRSLVFVFNAPHSSYEKWAAILSEVAYVVEGKSLEIVIDEDSSYTYTGRGHITTAKENTVNSEIEIACYCQPMKTSGSKEVI